MAIRRVLLVDDDEDIRLLIQTALSRLGQMDVLTAASGEQALQLAATANPDLVLLDLMMPDLDGWATLDHLRRRPETRDIPVILMTASGEADEGQLRHAGCAGVIRKPFNPVKLHHEIHRILTHHH